MSAWTGESRLCPTCSLTDARASLDIDWEYPANADEARAFVDLLRECREGLDKLAERKGKLRGQYQLTASREGIGARLAGSRHCSQIAAPCGAEWMEKLLVKEMDPYLDFWNLMVRGGPFSSPR